MGFSGRKRYKNRVSRPSCLSSFFLVQLLQQWGRGKIGVVSKTSNAVTKPGFWKSCRSTSDFFITMSQSLHLSLLNFILSVCAHWCSVSLSFWILIQSSRLLAISPQLCIIHISHEHSLYRLIQLIYRNVKQHRGPRQSPVAVHSIHPFKLA